jgi:ribonuclease G
MSKELWIARRPGETVALVRDAGRAVDLFVHRPGRGVTGNVYRGRALSVDWHLAAAFVDIGLDEPGFLPLAEPDTAGLTEGSAVLVRAVREPRDGKGAKLSTRIEARPEWQAAPVPSLVQDAQDPVSRAAAVHGFGAFDLVLTDEPGYAQGLRRRYGRISSTGAARIRAADRHPEEGDWRAALDAEVWQALDPEVPLPSGGRLLIEPVRTLTAVDVDSGPAGRTEANLEAARAIPRQLRLRGLGGLVVIDFLESEIREDRRQTAETLEASLAGDPARVEVGRITGQGVMQVTRQRLGPALYEVMTEPCGLYASGRVLTAETLALQALDRAVREAAGRPAAAVTLRLAPEVVDVLRGGPGAAAHQAAMERLGRTVAIEADVSVARDASELRLA